MRLRGWVTLAGVALIVILTLCPTEASSASGVIEVLMPDGSVVADSAPAASFFDYPATSGALVHVGAIARARNRLVLTDLSLLGGRVSALQLRSPSHRGRGFVVEGLIVDGVAVPDRVDSVYSLGGGSYVVASEVAVAAGDTGVVGLRLHLAQSEGVLPAGSEILVGVPAAADRDRSPGTLGVLGLAGIVTTGALGPLPPGGSGYVYPLAVRGTVIGCPFVPGSTHSPFAWPNNLASDDAVDIAVPVGTPVLAVASGTIGSLIGPLDSSDPRLAGLRVHLDTPYQHFYYAHLSRLDVYPGEHVRAGQQIGLSGSAAGVAHLHFAQDGGNPADTIGDHTACPYFIQYYEPWG